MPPIFSTDRSSSIAVADGLDDVVSKMGEMRLGSERGPAQRGSSVETVRQAGGRSWTRGLVNTRRQVLVEDEEVDDQDDGGGAAV
jgi:hypothetical protein